MSCDTATSTCTAWQCRACEDDGDCLADATSCHDLPSGAYCLLACTEDVDGACPEGAGCVLDGDEAEEGLCLPVEGDCVCAEAHSQRCLDGDLVWYDSCGGAGDVAEDCAGRGCLDGACCAVDMVLEDGACVDVEPPKPDAGDKPGGHDTEGGDDTGNDESDAGTGADVSSDEGGSGSSSCAASGVGAAPAPLGFLLLLFAVALAVVRRRGFLG